MNEVTEYRTQLAVEFDQLFNAIDNALNEWDQANSEGTKLQLPTLMTTLTIKFNWDDKLMRENDPIVRKYIRKHPKWYVTRGANGGIMRRAEWDKKNEEKVAKELAKEQMKAAILAKAAAAQNNSDSTDSE
jgi:hypothetical protein